eukprot:CAMPEP_0202032548 /NCGR_PEP_ID=MMETSP0905-20130828/65580_1 /ASSEMBLY_ACC=CAM_ASM_000554 /TAXON_ID=420261 /ORGANISM="Thalassiosira antarctica, Strain CCMP982" /LENGTH=515 /DNA_ID=CAMNT_0048596411 /DNA_START=42 /DNA_END=1590 /DNA_ORIENTATION=+
MGNSSSTNVFLSVNDSRTCITAGSTLSGEIRCPDHSVSTDLFSGVTLNFIGKEDVEVQYTDSGQCSGTRGGGAKYKAATRDIVRTIIPLDTSRNSVEAGRYPFQFHIPDHLPSSMYYKDGNGGYCSIRYKVKLHLMRGTDQEIALEIMAKPPSTSPIPSVADPTPTRIAFLYCIPQGSMTWAASAENTRVGVGESVTINLGMKNESVAKLERVTAKLKQTVEWHSSGHQSTNKSVIRSSSFDKTDSMGPCNKDGTISQAAQPLTVYEEVLNTVQEGNNQVTFPIPDYVPQSYTGRLVKIQYYISITAKTPSCFTNPKIHIPIEIVSPRNTPPIVTAQAIPMPSAPSLSYDEYFDTSDATAPYLANREEIVLDSIERKPLMTGINEYRLDGTSEPPPPDFDKSLIEPFSGQTYHGKDSLLLHNPKIHIPIEIVSPRNTPPIVTARVIPLPSAPSLSSDEYFGASDASVPYLANASVNEGGGEEIVLDSIESKPLMTMEETQNNAVFREFVYGPNTR